MSQASKLAMIQQMIDNAEASMRSAKHLISELTGGAATKASISKKANDLSDSTTEGEDSIVEGVFNGQTISDNKGKEYPVPANYASKSKLVQGDVLKLTIKPDGTFLYKQIGPVERKRVIGSLTYEDGQYKVIATGKAYNVLLASVTYFKGEVGDKITLVVPELEDSEWGAIENVLPSDQDDIDTEE